jgi:hypothetical protein
VILLRTPVPFATFGEPPTTTATEISSPSKILSPLASETTEGTSPSVTVSVGCDEVSSIAFHPALSKAASPSAISSVKYDEASSVVRGSEWAERRSPSLNASAGYDEVSSVVPRSELGDRPTRRARSSYRRRPSAVVVFRALQLQMCVGVEPPRF